MSREAGSRSWLASMRLAAAFAVVFDHAFLLTGRETPVVLAWSSRNLHLGGFAVLVFFVLSGYLVTSSWMQDPDLSRFLRKRALRIWPGLLVALTATALVLGPLVSTLPVSEYFRSADTWQYLRGALLAPVQLHLPGVFTGNPGTDYVNGSLWTLPLELLCYCLLAIAGMLGVTARRWPVPLAAGVLLVSTQLVPVLSLTGVGDTLMFFLLGATVRLYVPRLSAWHGAAAAALLVVSLLTGVYAPGALALACLVLYVGTRTSGPLTKADRFGDPSYGIYIYGYPLQQSLVLVGLTDVWPLMAVSGALVLGLGYASWHLVEKRAVHWGRGHRAHVDIPAQTGLPVERPVRAGDPALVADAQG